MTHKLIRGAQEVVELAAREAKRQGIRFYQRWTKSDAYRWPLDFERDRIVLLFFGDVEKDTFVRNDRYLRRAMRRGYHAFSGRQKVSGFGVWFNMLERALTLAGYRVIVNDHQLARLNPSYPVGIVGYPHILDHWSLPNPAVLGPGLLDHPQLKSDLMKDTRFRAYIISCDWLKKVFVPVYGDSCMLWYAGIDTEAWPDLREQPKDLDVLIYDKIRFNYQAVKEQVLTPLIRELERRKLSYQVLRYRGYDHEQYRSLLSRARSMAFLCEHETQGLAYQEAMSCNVPILAWDAGVWVDPNQEKYESEPVPASSVPYFSEQCGERFANAAAIPETLDRFWSRLESYTPRAYVQQKLSFAASAKMYLQAYRRCLAKG